MITALTIPFTHVSLVRHARFALEGAPKQSGTRVHLWHGPW